MLRRWPPQAHLCLPAGKGLCRGLVPHKINSGGKAGGLRTGAGRPRFLAIPILAASMVPVTPCDHAVIPGGGGILRLELDEAIGLGGKLKAVSAARILRFDPGGGLRPPL